MSFDTDTRTPDHGTYNADPLLGPQRRPSNTTAEQSRRHRRRSILGVNAVVLAALLIPLAVGLYNHVTTGFLFPPDSRYYMIMAYRDAGQTVHHALDLQYRQTGISAGAWYFSTSDPVWLMVQTRMLYPFLSAPFVEVLGPHAGMLAVPVLAMVTTVVAGARLVQRLYGPLAALAAAGLLAGSSLIITLTEVLTDPLAMALVALLLLNLPLGRRARAQHLIWLALLSALLCLTRQVLPMVAGLAVGGWLWSALFPAGPQRTVRARLRNPWLAPSAIVAGVSLTGQIIASALAPYDATKQLLLANHEPSIGAVLVDLPQLVWNMVTFEAHGMFVGDRYLLVLVAAPLLYALIRVKDVVVGLFLGGLAGTLVLDIANGIPSGMRYESVLLPVAVLGAGALAHRLLPAGSGPIPTTPATDPAPSWWQAARWRVPALAAASASSVALIIGWSATHGAASTVATVPTSPSAATALAARGLAESPGTHHRTADAILIDLLTQANEADRGNLSRLFALLDWRRPVRYTPTGPGYPGWTNRDGDGTAVIRFGDYVEIAPDKVGSGLSLRGTVVPESLAVQGRAVTKYGEDLAFTVLDDRGAIHHAQATVLYPTAEYSDGLITRLTYQK